MASPVEIAYAARPDSAIRVFMSALARLETGQRANPMVETLARSARAVGKRLVVSLRDA
jgi:hypothetical protein